jgi:hypothetical protein
VVRLSLSKLRLWCLLLLAAVAAHALLPVSPATDARSTGSPFNPATVDVATQHDRREAATPVAIEDGDRDRLTTTLAVLLVAVLSCLATLRTSAGAVAYPCASAPKRRGRYPVVASPRAPPLA